MEETLLRPVRGTRDLLPDEYYPLLEIGNKLCKIAETYGYLRVETPAFEHFEILKAKAGEEIINEIYYFKDKAGRELGLRFDLTVPIARIVSYRKDLPKPIRWYYFTKVWRYDEPQHGRYREFHQFGIELIGTKSPYADVEVLQVLTDALREVNLRNFQVKINDRQVVEHILETLGISSKDLKIKVLRILDKKEKVSEDELRRMLLELGLSENVVEKLLSIAGVKVPLEKCVDVLEELKVPQEIIQRYAILIDELKASGHVQHMYYDFSIVRGLDYYTGFVFEVYVPEYKLAVGGGGRYDDLIRIYSGTDVPALGFAIGVERLVEALSLQGSLPQISLGPDFYIYMIKREGKVRELGYTIANELRKRGKKVVIENGDKSLRAALEYASKIGAKYFLIIGPREAEQGKVKLRILEKWEEKELTVSELLGQYI